MKKSSNLHNVKENLFAFEIIVFLFKNYYTSSSTYFTFLFLDARRQCVCDKKVLTKFFLRFFLETFFQSHFQQLWCAHLFVEQVLFIFASTYYLDAPI